LLEYYFFAGAAGVAGAAAVGVAVDVTADLVAGAVVCCWHPTTKTVTTASAAMIANVFFIIFPPFFK
jgi:hypothetical protein